MVEACQELGVPEEESTEAAVNGPINYASIREHWDWVRVGIEEILAEQSQLTFRPEDVYAMCLKNDAHLWVAPQGFVISTSEVDEFTGNKTFLIWLAWTKERGQNCAMQYIRFFEQVARENGYQHIETRTPISRLESYFLADGWTKDTVIYTRAL